MWLLRILTCFVYARRTSWPNRPTDSTWLAGNRSFVAIAMFWSRPQQLSQRACLCLSGMPPQLLRDLKKFFGQRHEIVGRQPAMALVHRLGQRIGDAGAHPDHGGLVDAELHRDSIGGLEPDATDVAGQTIGILRHDLDGIAAVGLVDAHRPRGADPVAVQEDHDLADHLLLGPGRRDAAGSHRTDAIHLPQAIRLRLDDIEHLVAEGAQELLGIDWAYATDHSGSDILLDALDRRGRRGFEEPGFKLLTVGAVVDPAA